MSQHMAPWWRAARWVARYDLFVGVWGIEKPQSAGTVILARFACHWCVGSQTLSRWRFLYLGTVTGASLSAFCRILGRGRRERIPPESPVPCPRPILAASFCLCMRFRLASRSSFFAVAARSRLLVKVERNPFLAVWSGVLSASISLRARSRSFLGSLFALWLAVRRLMKRGTSWNPRVALTAFELRMLASNAWISYSRDFMKESRSTSPANAEPVVWVSMVLASENLTRFAARPERRPLLELGSELGAGRLSRGAFPAAWVGAPPDGAISGDVGQIGRDGRARYFCG